MKVGIERWQVRGHGWSMTAIVLTSAFVAQFVRIGGDWEWLVALGDHVRATGSVPDGVPFAAADTSGWVNVPVLAELMASGLDDLGARAAVLAHVAAIAMTLVVLAAAARARGGSDVQIAGAILLLCLGGLAALVIVRAQSLSLVPFALILALVARQAQRPDRRIWWAVPLIVVWGNLHGAALLGVCVLGAYLLVQRTRTHLWESCAVGVASVLALFATPQLWRTPLYYARVFDNVSAQRREGLWAGADPSNPLDVLMVLAVVCLLGLLLRSRRQPWEYVACLGLCLATASAARHGVWLLCLLVVLAPGRSMVAPADRPRDGRSSVGAASIGSSVAAVAFALPVVLVRGDLVLGSSPAVVRSVEEIAGTGVVLAPAPLSESLAASGVRLWAGNPLDAFGHGVQASYLDFLDGDEGARPAIRMSDVVVAREGSPQAALVSDDPTFVATPCTDDWICYVRR